MEDNHEADDLLYRIETAVDSLQYIAYGLMQQIGDDCEEGNAVQYVAYSIRENVKRARELLFQKDSCLSSSSSAFCCGFSLV